MEGVVGDDLDVHRVGLLLGVLDEILLEEGFVVAELFGFGLEFGDEHTNLDLAAH